MNSKLLRRILSYLLAVVLVLGMSLQLNSPVLATDQDREIDAEGSYTEGTYIGGAGNYTNLHLPNDGDTTRLNFVPAGSYAYHSFSINTFSASTDINCVTLHYMARGYGAVVLTPFVYTSGNNYYGTQQSIASSYTNYLHSWTTNPATGNPWTAAEINSAQWGIRHYGANPLQSNVTTLYVTVNYTLTVPTVVTSAADNITVNSATLWGDITSDGGSTIANYGFVWGTTDNETNPGNVAPLFTTYTDNWTAGGGTYSEGDISHNTGAILALGTTYYFRAVGYNSVGWSYGDQESFTTVSNPTILTIAASNVASTTAQLNASVTYDGGQACQVEWVYVSGVGPYLTYAAIDAAGGDVHVSATGTYTMGQLPYYSLGGLALATQYWFCASVTNSASTGYSTPLTFTTEAGASAPTNLSAIPTSSTVSLTWVKGVGASNTVLRVSSATYPSTYSSGTLLYAGTGVSYIHSGLTAGTNYYYSAWGLNSDNHSVTYAYIMATTLAEGAEDISIGTPTTPSSWNQTPSTSKIQNIPFYAVINVFADSYHMPQSTMWYGLSIMFAVSIGYFMYWRGNKNLLASIIATAIGLAIGAVEGILQMWIPMFFCIIGISMAWMAQRY